MSTTIQSVQLSNGLSLPYIEQGDANGTPVVLVHGFGDSLHSWDLLWPLMPGSIRTVALTQRGHGDVGRPDSGYELQDFSDDLAEFLDVLEIESAIIVGHSLGAMIAQRFAFDYPQRVLGLALIGVLNSLKNIPDYDDFAGAFDQLEDPVDPDFIRAFQESTVALPVKPQFFETILQESAKVPANVWRKVMRGLLAADNTNRLAESTAPTLLFWGAHDTIAPCIDQETILAAIPDAKLLTYLDGGHSLQWETPDRVAGDLIAFINEVTGR